MDEVDEVINRAHRDAIVYKYGFIVVNRAGGICHIAPHYVDKILDEVEYNVEMINRNIEEHDDD